MAVTAYISSNQCGRWAWLCAWLQFSRPWRPPEQATHQKWGRSLVDAGIHSGTQPSRHQLLQRIISSQHRCSDRIHSDLGGVQPWYVKHDFVARSRLPAEGEGRISRTPLAYVVVVMRKMLASAKDSAIFHTRRILIDHSLNV